VDKGLGDRVEAGVRTAQAESPEPSQDATPTP
jgi:hypothetical protein